MGWLLLLIMTCTPLSEHKEAILRVNSTHTEVLVIGQPKQNANWSILPFVRVCRSSEVPEYRAEQAVRFWKTLGYEFEGIATDFSTACMNPRYGEIIITLPESDFSSKHMASTRIYTDNSTGKIVKAKIHILPKHARKLRVLEHEFGHALGWSHYAKTYHIMHPEWENGGTNTQGLRKK